MNFQVGKLPTRLALFGGSLEDPRDRYPEPLPALLRELEQPTPTTTEVGQVAWLPAVLGGGGMMRVFLVALLWACLGVAVAGVLTWPRAGPDCRSSAPVTVLAGQSACSPLLMDSVSRVLSRAVSK